MSGPFATPRRGRPVVGTESPKHLDEPLPLLAEHLEKMLGIQVAFAGDSQV
jgi:ABC-type phosphate/phosphonate transport system substrate-binding protein